MREELLKFGRPAWKYAAAPALSYVGGQLVIAILKNFGLDLVAIVHDIAPQLTKWLSPDTTSWILAFAIGSVIYGVGYYFLFRKKATASFADSEIADADPWDDLNEASRRFRDMLRTQPEETALREFDRSARRAKTEGKRDPVVYAFHG